MLTYSDFSDYISATAGILFNDLDRYDAVSDALHEFADSSTYAIYYGNAWDLVNLIRDNDWNAFLDAEEMVNEVETITSGAGFSLDVLMTRYAYWIVYNALDVAVLDLIGEEGNR